MHQASFFSGRGLRMVKLITDNILNLTPQFWKERGVDIKKWVLDDCLNGKMQNGNSNYQYKSAQYKLYKANDMKRMTVGKAKDTGYTFNLAGDIRYLNLYFRNRKAKFTQKNPMGSGKRLKAYAGIPIASNDVSKVTMVLTQRTVNSLHPKSSTENSVTMAFAPDKTKLLLGNRDRGYDIIGLNGDNIGKIKKKILAEFVKNSKTNVPPTISITVS